MLPRVGEHAPAFAEHRRVERDQAIAERDVGLGVIEIAERRAGELVRRAVLMDEPRHLARMAGEIGRKLRGDEDVDRAAVAFAEIEQTPGGGMRENLGLRVPLEGHAHELGVVPVRAQMPHELAHVKLGAALHERHLGLAHRRPALGGMPEFDDVPVSDQILLALEPQLAVLTAGGERSAREQPIVGNDLGANEAALNVGVNRAGGFRRR